MKHRERYHPLYNPRPSYNRREAIWNLLKFAFKVALAIVALYIGLGLLVVFLSVVFGLHPGDFAYCFYVCVRP